MTTPDLPPKLMIFPALMLGIRTADDAKQLLALIVEAAIAPYKAEIERLTMPPTNLCGSRGFAGPSACVRVDGHAGPHKYGNFDAAVKAHEDQYWQRRAEQAEAARAAEREYWVAFVNTLKWYQPIPMREGENCGVANHNERIDAAIRARGTNER